MQWSRPIRFQRVCPLLVETLDGLRCSANTTDVRPFWGRTLRYYGGVLGTLYVIAVLAVFVFLRTIGYPVSILDIGLPPLWHRLAHARGWYFFEQSQRAFTAGRSAEGVLYLANAYEFDPANYKIGITLAKNYQLGQPAHSDEVFERLIREHPEHRNATAQDWFRALLARGSFEKITALARDQLLTDDLSGHVWMRALLFATHQIGDDQPLRALLSSPVPAAGIWRPLIETELLMRSGRTADARAAVDRKWPDGPPAFVAFSVYYRVSVLIALRDAFAALDLLDRNLQTIDEEARRTLRLEAFASAGAKQQLRIEIEQLLGPRHNLPRVKILCAHLIRHPNAEVFARLSDKLDYEKMPLDSDSAGIWFSLLCAAGVVGDQPRLHLLTEKLKRASTPPFMALGLVEGFFLGKAAERRITSVLPILPLPAEVTYSLLEHYALPARGVVLPVLPRK